MAPSGRSSQARGRSRVPDHVRNPHKYTVYQFDEPVTVGGGDRAAAVSGHDNDQVRQSIRFSRIHQRLGTGLPNWQLSSL